ncbi:MAG: TonB-dependent receptor domain-containing protein, partial [Flavisolibacter sp.]
HTATLGAQFDHSTTVNGFQRFATSYYRFNSWDDFINGENPNDFALTYSLLPGFQQAFPSFKFAQLSIYAQDEMALTDRFRLTAGLRVDMPSYPDVTEIREHPLVSALSFAGGEKLNTGNLPKTTPLWSPRVGFNWDINGDRSFQLRGGSGIFTGRVPFVWIVSQSGDAGLLQVTQSWNGLSNTPGPFNPNPSAYLPATVPTPGSVVPSAITALTEDFKFPQTWKTSLGMDRRLPGNLVLTIEAIYNKDLNTAMFRNANLVEGQNLNIAGYPDNRPMYPATVRDRFLNPLTSATYNATTNPNPSTPVPNGDTRGTQAFNAIVMDNGTQGYYFSFTTKLEKQFSRGWFASIAYTKSIAENLFDGGGDQPLSAWQGTPTFKSPNNPGLGTAGFVVPDRVIAAISYRKEYLKHLGTTISIFYEGSTQGRFSYLYSSDFNRDGITGNDLIYVPRDPSEITFVDRPASSATGGVAYTAAQQSALFFQYIDQDKYLRERKGQYAERNGAKFPWRNQFDLKVIQDVFMNIGRNRNTLQFTLDIFNFGNLINSDWGKLKTVNAPSLLVPQTVSNTAKPTFWLQMDRNHPVTETYRDNLSIFSTYFMQFGLRYNFN